MTKFYSQFYYDIRVILSTGGVFEITLMARNANDALMMAQAQYAGHTVCVLRERWPE